MYKKIWQVIFASIILVIASLFYDTRKIEVEKNDPRYMRPYKRNTINFTFMILSIISSYSAILCLLYRLRQMPATAQKMLSSGMLATLLLTVSLTENTKKIVGRPRPDYLDRIKMDGAGRYIRNSRVIEDGRKSFPSGHTSMIFCAVLFTAYTCSLYTRRYSTLFAFSLLLLLLACGVGWTRVYDNRHFTSDVLAGAAAGVMCAAAVASIVDHNRKDWL